MIKPKTRQKVMRLIISSIVGSDLTESELIDVARELQTGSLGYDIGMLVGLFADQIRTFDRHDETFRTDDRRVLLAKDLMQRGKITKTKMVKLARQLPVPGLPSPSTTTADGFLEAFFALASDRDAERFITMLDQGGTDDPFLAGIMQRNK